MRNTFGAKGKNGHTVRYWKLATGKKSPRSPRPPKRRDTLKRSPQRALGRKEGEEKGRTHSCQKTTGGGNLLAPPRGGPLCKKGDPGGEFGGGKDGGKGRKMPKSPESALDTQKADQRKKHKGGGKGGKRREKDISKAIRGLPGGLGREIKPKRARGDQQHGPQWKRTRNGGATRGGGAPRWVAKIRVLTQNGGGGRRRGGERLARRCAGGKDNPKKDI